MEESTSCALASKLNSFSFTFNDIVLKENAGNVVCSPFSIYSALALLNVGAANKTRKEINAALGMDNDDLIALLELLNPLYSDVSSGAGGATFKFANNVWVGKNVNVLKSYESNLLKYFDVNIGRADFVHCAETARAGINNWVEEQTAGKIQDLFSADSIGKMTRLVLANAVYFKGEWKEKFDSGDTAEFDFFVNKNKSVKVDFMIRHGEISTGFDKKYNMHLLELPYAGERFSMVFAIPAAEDGIDGEMLFEDLDLVQDKMGDKVEVFNNWIAILNNEKVLSEVDILVPKFKFNLPTNLTSLLIQLGINDASIPGVADFSGINGQSGDLFVSSAVHKAFIEVDEEGTTAAASTGFAMNRMMMASSRPQEVFLNHPFLFYIIHKHSTAIIFSGRVKNPLELK